MGPKSKIASSNQNIRKYMSGGAQAGAPSATAQGGTTSEAEIVRQKAGATQTLEFEKNQMAAMEEEIKKLENYDASKKGARLKELEGELAAATQGFGKSQQNGSCRVS